MSPGQLNASDLFKTVNLDKLGKIPGKLNKNTKSLRDELGKIYMELMELVVEDIIENNVTFKFTLTLDRKGTLQIRPIRDEFVKKLMQNGSLDGLDFLKTDFILFFKASYFLNSVSIHRTFHNISLLLHK